ncbi:cell wall-binding repeat-containing protein [Herbiconiux ginsengi]|nr:cell wall-binding repeat-containing protein [Herbiconiux ginsengi]
MSLSLLTTLTVAGAGISAAGAFASPAESSAPAQVPRVSRIAGSDRFDVAVQISQRMFPAGNSALYIASGANFPDALSAGPAAIHWGNPLLIVPPDRVPAQVASEIVRLHPLVIKVVGGENSVSRAVFDQIQALAPSSRVFRLGGTDRYAVSRAVVADAFPFAWNAYVTTGNTFADALSATPAAGQALDPVILVDGRAATVDKETLDLLGDLTRNTIRIVGGRDSVSDAVESWLWTVRPVLRIDGTDRFDASINVNRKVFTSAKTVYLATGLNYPDALTGGVLAGVSNSPLYVVPTSCVPQKVLLDIQQLGATDVVLIGGEASLSSAVSELTPCVF